jgi:hypothetical protein
MTPTQPEKKQEETTLWNAPEKLDGESTAIFQKIETKKKRWNSGMNLEYDPVKDEFFDTASKRPVYALLDGDEEEFFDEDTEVDPMKFESNNSNWIKRGGGGALDMQKVLGVKLEEPPSQMEKFQKNFYEQLKALGRR